jgi:serine/threonine protein phosphatase PrpC
MAKNLRGKLTSRPKWTSAYRARDPDLLASSIASACYDLDEGLRGDASRPTRDGGTTAIIALVCDRHLIMANVGDSRCILARKKKREEDMSAIEVVPMSEHHRRPPRQELDTNFLSVSRAFGDYNYKSNAKLPPSGQAMVCTPDIAVRERADHEDIYLILAYDRIWDVMSNDDVGEFVARWFEERRHSSNDDDDEEFPRGEVLARVGE